MYLTFITLFLFITKTINSSNAITVKTSPLPFAEDNTTAPQVCPHFGEVEHANVKIINTTSVQIALIECNEGYDIDGDPNITCVEGQWQFLSRPQCNERCYPPPYLKNGYVQIEGEKSKGRYLKGTLATYLCSEGFRLTPKESEYRVCEKGIWTGAFAKCEHIKRITSCPPPRNVSNGYFVHEKTGDFPENGIGQRLHYSCKGGFFLIGATVQLCLDDGTWSPKIPPTCSSEISEDYNNYICPAVPTVPHSFTTTEQGYQPEHSAWPGTIVQIHCLSKYRNTKEPCRPGKLRCFRGRWIGSPPVCAPVRDCDPPPAITNGLIYNLSPPIYESSLFSKYPIKSQISYQCLPGFTLQGNEIFACSPGGCWLPEDPPTCYRTTGNNNYFLEVNCIQAVLISAAAGASVLTLLLLICFIVACKRRKALTRAIPIAPPAQRSDLGDHTTLLRHPDRLAIIGYAEGMQNDQAALPTYDEATRDRTLNLTSNRLYRPHWPNLGGRRSRNAPTADMVHVTRHGSFASHTPSTRSAGDSMGSTDTVAVSEGSTNVTLDTASSHSGSQPASCRVHCGSLASFDTSSVVNTEGVPLLEESELEEVQGGDNISLVVVLDNPSISDNVSFKLSTHSSELA